MRFFFFFLLSLITGLPLGFWSQNLVPPLSPSRRARDSLQPQEGEGREVGAAGEKNCHDSKFCQRAFVLMKTARAPQAHGTLLLPYFLWLVKVVKAERLVKEAETVMVFVG